MVEEDEDFRRRAANASTEDELGPAAWLWLARPERWEERFEALVADAVSHAKEADAERADQRLERRLAVAEEKADRAATRAAEDRERPKPPARTWASSADGVEPSTSRSRGSSAGRRSCGPNWNGSSDPERMRKALAAREGELRQARDQPRRGRRARAAPPVNAEPGVEPARARQALDRAQRASEDLGRALEELARSVPEPADPPPPPRVSRSRFRPVSQRMGPKRRSSSCAGLARWPSWTATTSRCRRGPTRKSPSSAVALWTSWLLWLRSRAPNPMWCSTEPTPIPRPFAPTAGQSGCGSLLRGSRPTTRSSSWSTVIPSGARSWWCRATGECTMVPWPEAPTPYGRSNYWKSFVEHVYGRRPVRPPS